MSGIDEHVHVAGGGPIRNTISAGYSDPLNRPSDSMPVGSPAWLGATWREEQEALQSRLSQGNNNSGGNLLFGFIGLVLCLVYSNTCAIAVGGLLAIFAVNKVASDFTIHNSIKRAVNLFLFASTCFVTYYYFKHFADFYHPWVTSFVPEKFSSIITGIVLICGIYICVRDKILHKFNKKTGLKVFVCVCIAAAGMKSGGNQLFYHLLVDHSRVMSGPVEEFSNKFSNCLTKKSAELGVNPHDFLREKQYIVDFAHKCSQVSYNKEEIDCNKLFGIETWNFRKIDLKKERGIAMSAVKRIGKPLHIYVYFTALPGEGVAGGFEQFNSDTSTLFKKFGIISGTIIN